MPRISLSFSVGEILLSYSPDGLEEVLIASRTGRVKKIEYSPPWLKDLVHQFKNYFSKRFYDFGSTPLLFPKQTPLQRQILDVVRGIPYGEMWSYGKVAELAGNRKYARAVGLACHMNPFPIIIPCHRVISGDGKLGGYSEGVDIKQKLLVLEGALS